MTGVLIYKGEIETETQGRRPYEEGGLEALSINTSEEIPGAARRWKRQGRIHLDFGLLASSAERTCLYCFKPPSSWHFVTAALEK